jgi:hypothetical protein
MGEKAVLEFARAVDEGYGMEDIRGLCYISKEKPEGYIELPSHEEVTKNKDKFIEIVYQKKMLESKSLFDF